MKLLSFQRPDGSAACGKILGDGVADLTMRLGVASIRALLGAGRLSDAAAVTDIDLPLDGLRFLPVIPDPAKIVCVGLNYRDHVAETGRSVTEKPALFARFAESQVGHGQPLIRPKASERFDYEGELAVIIGTAGRHIPRARAFAHVAGYACYNEGSVRDWQLHTSQYLPGKTFAGTGAFGPWMVTADEIPDPSALTLETRLNGQVVQRTTTDLMITDIPGIIEYLSTVLPLAPGDVIVTGTPGGVGAKRNPPLWMKAGDVAEVEISGIGTLRNRVEDEA
jgi:2-keto-4-pentenoate hydratase/2-oxohepta-3-ene-1,7-dioic acid hydratase in catechol pathway